MGIVMSGIDHKFAPIDIRSLFSFAKKETSANLAFLKGQEGISGCVLISTCNRTELYLSCAEDFKEDPAKLLCALKGADYERYRKYFITRKEEEAIRHLFRLACGLESRILGDDQIVTQVKEALSRAREVYAADHVLETLFRQAVTAAKKVKTEIAPFSADRSVVRTAVESLKEMGYVFSGKRCMVIGNGVIGKLAADTLKEEGSSVTVTVRQYHSGVVEIPRDCARIDYGKRIKLLNSCDYVVSATRSPNYTLTKEAVEPVLTHPIVLLDLAVPRDIEPAVGALGAVTLFDVDMFKKEADPAQQKAVKRAGDCLEKQMDAFYDWYNCLDVLAQIESVRSAFGRDVALRLTKEIRALPLEISDKKKLQGKIGDAAARAANALLFTLRDGVDEKAFRDSIDALSEKYGKERK